MSRSGNVVWLRSQLCPLWTRVLGSLVLAVSGGMLSTLDPLLMRRLIDYELPHRQLAGSLALVLAIAGCLLGSVLALLWSHNLNFHVEQDVGQKLRIAILEQLNRLSADFHENTPAGDNMTRLGADVDQISQLTSEIASSTVRAAVFLLVNLAVMLYLNATMTLAIVPTLLLFSWIQAHFASSMSERADVAQKETGRASSILYEYLSALPQIQLLCAEKVALTNAVSVWSRMVRARKSQKSTELLYAVTVNGAFILATLLVLALGSYQFLRGALTIGALVAFYTYQTRVFEPVSMATDLYSRLQRVGASIRRVRAVLDSESLVPDYGKIAMSPRNIAHGISLDKVRYSYGSERIALCDVSLCIGAGESLAIVGPSGSGKSTLARLLVRLSDPQSGNLTLDGYPLRDYSLAALRQTICYVPQRPLLFDGSVRENLLYANPDATTEDLFRATDAAQFRSVLDQLPAGLDTQLGPLGHSLSGGELQRLALARALLRKAPVLVLDESTSALDIPTEQLILESIADYCSGSMLIIITHRLASISWMRRIVVLNHGQIAAVGDHDFLHKNSPLYHRLYESNSVTVQ
jgi:ABC-type bacteriocin/lantibiotic exporter with double-glycine peptidase domain